MKLDTLDELKIELFRFILEIICWKSYKRLQN